MCSSQRATSTSFLTEVDVDGGAAMGFSGFCELSKKHYAHYVRSIAKLVRIPRAYLTPAQYDQYATIFREFAGADAQLERSELQQFFNKYNMSVSPDRLQGIMAEVDDDNSGTLQETEFLVLLIKALGLKKRKIGPGQCDVKMLKDEGWTMVEIKRAGYECKDLIESDYAVEELLPLFTAPEFAKAGVTFSDMIAAGWDCARARESGYSLEDMVEAGCSVQRIRDAGFDDLDAAVALRKQGVPAAKMKASGWPLSFLKEAGYSATELRLAGYSALAVGAVQQLVAQQQQDDEIPASPRSAKSPGC